MPSMKKDSRANMSLPSFRPLFDAAADSVHGEQPAPPLRKEKGRKSEDAELTD